LQRVFVIKRVAGFNLVILQPIEYTPLVLPVLELVPGLLDVGMTRQQIDRLWPGAIVRLKAFRKAHLHVPEPTPIIETTPLQRDRLRGLLGHCPNPLLALSDAQILALYRREMGRAGPALLRRLRTSGREAVLPPPEIAASLADQVHRLFVQYCAAKTLIAEGRGRLAPLIHRTPARHLHAIPGLGPNDAAVYWAGLGSSDRFFRDAEVWAFAGFDPIFERGKSELEATIHAAHKVNRLCFHFLKHDEAFVSQTTPQLEAEKNRRWQAFKAAKRKRGGRRKRGKRRR
jgi:transposase